MSTHFDIGLQFIAPTAISTSVALLVLFLMRTWITARIKESIKNEYDQKLETHKATLKAQSDVEQERLRTQLKMSAHEHAVRFNRLHEKRADVISRTFYLLNDLHGKIGDYVNVFEPAGFPSREKRQAAAIEAHKSFQNYYYGRSIFLPKETDKKLEEIDKELIHSFNEFVWKVDKASKAGSYVADDWTRIFQRVRDEIRNAMEDLKDEFRDLLGDGS